MALGVAYTATDPDVAGDGETKGVNTATWATAGPDGSKFTVTVTDTDTDGELKFKAQPDYEKPADANKDNVYEVTVTVADERGERGMRKVKVTVTDANELGVVTLSETYPRVGIPITASLSDPDLSVTAVTWQWSNNGGDDGDIEGATTDTYKPVTADVTKTLTATASYFDGHSAPAPLMTPRRRRPKVLPTRWRKTLGTRLLRSRTRTTTSPMVCRTSPRPGRWTRTPRPTLMTTAPLTSRGRQRGWRDYGDRPRRER